MALSSYTKLHKHGTINTMTSFIAPYDEVFSGYQPGKIGVGGKKRGTLCAGCVAG
jgi:hypothetical protein